MHHVNVIIHFLALVSGGCFFTVAGLEYMKRKAYGIKVAIIAEGALTLLLLLDSLDIYTRKNATEYYGFLHDIISGGVLFGGIGLLGCLLHAVCKTGSRTAYVREFVTTLAEQRTAVYICLALSAVGTAILLAVNLSNSLPAGVYQVPYSPMIYCLLNLVGVMTLSYGNPQAMLQARYGITERENEIIQYVVCGKGNQEISDQLFISLNTVKNHISNIYRKMGIKSRYELISEYERLKRNRRG